MLRQVSARCASAACRCCTVSYKASDVVLEMRAIQRVILLAAQHRDTPILSLRTDLVGDFSSLIASLPICHKAVHKPQLICYCSFVSHSSIASPQSLIPRSSQKQKWDISLPTPSEVKVEETSQFVFQLDCNGQIQTSANPNGEWTSNI
jgi:hypothetical protein